MSVTLTLAKQHLRVRQNDDDTLITQFISTGTTMLTKLIGEDVDLSLDDIVAAHLLLIEWLYDPAEKVELDPIYKLPLAIVALAVPYRTPTVV